MDKFTSHTGVGVPLRRSNVDTDQIIPAVYLKRVTRSGFEDGLFAAWRNDPGFVLNDPAYAAGSVLVAGPDFGTGSSREHAVWAIQQAGFQVVIARKTDDSPGYSDIFRSNAGNCGLLLTELKDGDHAKFVAAGSGAEATVDLARQKIILNGEEFHFDIAETTKQQLLAGLDLVGTTLQFGDDITEFEKQWSSFAPKAVTP